ncbi:MAG: DUF899 family protein [Pseudomonadales bacterium]|jgi:predicted dithiol-disulfide oxidoreductase (DUF899 family)|nr:DUF899 family protein [Pseudomonadales bacterium]
MATAEEDPTQAEIMAIEQQILALHERLVTLRRARTGTPVPDYRFETLHGPVTLSDLFAGREQLLAIHNMGEACRYCTLWGDGLNGLLPHLEDAMAVALLSGDSPAVQQRFAAARGWRFRMASHGGGAYLEDQSVIAGGGNMPGAVVYARSGKTILRRNACVFGPGDSYCALWGLLGLGGLDASNWTPQYSYWTRPARLADGGENLID